MKVVTESFLNKTLENYPNKNDLAKLRKEMATKDDLIKLRKEMATKGDIKNMATKDDLRDLKISVELFKSEIRVGMDSVLEIMMETKNALSSKVENNSHEIEVNDRRLQLHISDNDVHNY